MSVIAAIRPDSWNFPLFLHVLGAIAWGGAIFLLVFFLMSLLMNIVFAQRNGIDSKAFQALYASRDIDNEVIGIHSR